MILDDHDDEPVDVEDLAVDGDDLDDDTAGEWLDGLRAAGLPIRADATDRPPLPALPPTRAADTVAGLVAESLAHAAERAVGRLGFENVGSARSALQDLGQSIKSNGFPAGTIPDTNPGRLLVPFGDGGYAVYQIASNGNAVLKTVLIAG